MRASKSRIKAGLAGTPGLAFRKLVDADGDSGPFLILLLENAEIAQHLLTLLRHRGFHNAFRLAGYGLHIYSNIAALVKKTPLSPAGNPWSAPENLKSVYDYAKGACPASDALFERSVLLPVPSCLTPADEDIAIRTIRNALRPEPAAASR